MSSPRVGATRAPQRAQATVETAIILPVVVLLMAVLVQVVLVVRDEVHLVAVTSSAARAVMVEPTESVARSAVDSTSGNLEVERIVLSGGRGPGSLLTIEVTARPQRLPLVGLAATRVLLSERVTVRVEG